jgi:hypothetical protein
MEVSVDLEPLAREVRECLDVLRQRVSSADRQTLAWLESGCSIDEIAAFSGRTARGVRKATERLRAAFGLAQKGKSARPVPDSRS